MTGFLITRFSIQPIIATLGTMLAARGFALVVSHGNQSVTLAPGNDVLWLGYGQWLGVPASFVIVIAITVAATVLLDRLRLGRRLLMIGSNARSAQLVGVPVMRTVVTAYALCGLSAGIAGMMFVGRASAGLPTEGYGLELQAIAAAVMGGTALTGGVGWPPFVLVGALFVQTLLNRPQPRRSLALRGRAGDGGRHRIRGVARLRDSPRRSGSFLNHGRLVMKWRTLAALTAVTAVAALLGLPSVDAGAASTTIGFSMPDSSESFWTSMAYGVDDEAKKLGVTVVKVNAGGDANVNQQISQIQDLVQRHVNAIIVGATNGDAVRPAVEQAIAAKIPVVGLSSIPNTPKLASAVGADHYAMGKLQAQCLGKAIGGSGEVGMMAGPAGQSWADLRADGFRDTIKADFPKIKIVTESRLADNRNAALNTTEDWVQRFPDPQGRLFRHRRHRCRRGRRSQGVEQARPGEGLYLES